MSIDKRIPLNLDLEKLLSHYKECPDTSKYEERRKRNREYKAKWQKDHKENRRLANSKYRHSEKGIATNKAYAADHREELNANSRAYYQRHLEEMREKGRKRYYERKDRKQNEKRNGSGTDSPETAGRSGKS